MEAFIIFVLYFFLGYATYWWVKGIDYMRTNHPEYKGMDFFGQNESLEDTKLMYVRLGVDKDKIVTTETPSIVDYNGHYISLHIRTELTQQDIEEINNSDGIIVTNKVYGKPYFRYGFIKK